MFLLGANGDQFIGIFEKRAAAVQVKALETNDSFFVKLNADDDKETEWRARVCQTLPMVPENMICCVINAPAEAKATLPFSTEWKDITTTASTSMWLRVGPNHTDLKRRLNALNMLRTLDDPILKDSLVGRDISIKKEVDFFEGLKDDNELLFIVRPFSDSQAFAFRYCRKLLNGEGYIQGPPRTEKLYYIT